jgi:hypothetical protein
VQVKVKGEQTIDIPLAVGSFPYKFTYNYNVLVECLGLDNARIIHAEPDPSFKEIDESVTIPYNTNWLPVPQRYKKYKTLTPSVNGSVQGRRYVKVKQRHVTCKAGKGTVTFDIIAGAVLKVDVKVSIFKITLWKGEAPRGNIVDFSASAEFSCCK